MREIVAHRADGLERGESRDRSWLGRYRIDSDAASQHRRLTRCAAARHGTGAFARCANDAAGSSQSPRGRVGPHGDRHYERRNRRRAQSSAAPRPLTRTAPAGLVGDGATGIAGRVAVAARVLVTVRVGVSVRVFVAAGVFDGVSVLDGVSVADAVLVVEPVGVVVGVFDAVLLCDAVGDGPIVGVSVTVGVLVRVAVAVCDAVAVPVLAGATVFVAVNVAVAVRVDVIVVVAEAVLVGWVGPTTIWPLDGSHVGVPSFSWHPPGISTIPSTISVLKVSGLTPLARPVKVIWNSVPLPVIGMLLQVIVIVRRPAVAVFTTGVSQAAARAPRATVPTLMML